MNPVLLIRLLTPVLVGLNLHAFLTALVTGEGSWPWEALCLSLALANAVWTEWVLHSLDPAAIAAWERWRGFALGTLLSAMAFALWLK